MDIRVRMHAGIWKLDLQAHTHTLKKLAARHKKKSSEAVYRKKR